MPRRKNRIPGISKRVLKDGTVRWRAVVDAGQPGERKQITNTFATQADAEAWRADKISRRRRGDVVEPSRMPLAEWFDQWIEVKSARVRPSSAYNYRTTFRRLIPLIGSQPLASITPSAIQKAYNALSAQYGPTTLRGVHRVLKMVLEAAVNDGLLTRNPAMRVDAPGRPAEARQTWTLEQARTFLASLGDGHYDDAWRFILETWVRSGEVRALRWSDIDLDQAVVTISRTVTIADSGWQGVGPPKSGSSRREIPLSAAMVERLRERKHAAKVRAFQFGEGWSDERLVFPGQHGGIMHPSRMNLALRQACAKVGVPHITVHGIRHTGGSLAHAAGVPIVIISQRLGHSNPAITWQIYTHQDSDQAQTVGDTMARLLG